MVTPNNVQATPTEEREQQVIPMEDKERRLSDIADLARAASAGDDAFAGAGIDVDAGEVRIWRVGGDKPAELASRYTKLGDESTPVRILPAVISRKQAVVLQEAVMRDYETLRAEGIEVQGWGMAPDRVFRIGVRDAQRHRETLLSRYGGLFGRHTIRVEESHVVPLSGRQDDGPPYYGGARFYRAGLTAANKLKNGCTTGYGGV